MERKREWGGKKIVARNRESGKEKGRGKGKEEADTTIRGARALNNSW